MVASLSGGLAKSSEKVLVGSAWRGDPGVAEARAGLRKPRAPSTGIGPSESPVPPPRERRLFRNPRMA